MIVYCEYCGLPENECICPEEDESEDILECPECGAMWGIDEITRGVCYACGYPNNDFELGDYDESDMSDRYDLTE